MEIKLFLPEHVDSVFDFEKSRLPGDLSEIQIEMKSWENPWRKESLNHYSSLGWSFVAEEEGKLLGYILGQPFLFFNNWTQSVWIEHLGFVDEKVGFQLLDTMVRWSKTKHLQKVIMNSKSDKAPFAEESMRGFKKSGYLHLSTTKMDEE